MPRKTRYVDVPEPTVGDLIIAKRDSQWGILPAGTEGQVVGMVNGVPAYLALDAGPGYAATSSTPLTIGDSGSKAFETQAGLAYSVGARLRATSTGGGDYMEGVVTDYTDTTLTVTMDHASGSGSHADWTINLAGDVGAIGETGDTGPSFSSVTAQASPSNQGAINSATGKMLGLAGSITPGTTQILVLISGQLVFASNGTTCTLRLRYGTGSAPANGDAATGTAIGGASTVLHDNGGGDIDRPVTLHGIATGLTPNTPYWLDVSIVDDRSMTITGVNITAHDL